MKLFVTNVVLILLIQSFYAQERVVNYDEDKVGTNHLPNILEAEDKKDVSTVKGWEQIRRPEILNLFENEVYGKMPKEFDKIEFSRTNSNTKAMDGKALMKEIKIDIFRNKKSVTINLVLFVPKRPNKPAPAFLLINNRSKRNTMTTRDSISGFWPAEEIIKAGYAAAAFQVDDAAPDNKATYTQGVLELYPEQLEMSNGMRAIGAWAWAASRAMDYFESDKDIDASKVIVVGHSRGGKASLWAAAEDQRFAACISNNSGNTGAALSRRNFGETVEIINTSFPYWFDQNYKKYNGNEQDLPIDQHMLLGLIAPRPLYVTSASTDLWADPKGMFMAMKEAEPVYKMYGHNQSLPESQPFMNRPIMNFRMGYHIRDGAHNLTEYDWDQFIKFADYHLKVREPR